MPSDRHSVGSGFPYEIGSRVGGCVPAAGGRRHWLILAVTVAAAVMDQLDGTVVNLAAPSIRRDLGGGLGTIQWYSAAYTLPFAVLLITGGRLGDIYGRRRVFLVGTAGFTVFSLVCAAATAPWMLIAARVVQGSFGAVLTPQGFGLVRSVFPTDQLPKAFAAFAPAMGLASVAGPTVAGALIDANLFGTGWRLIFLINVPIGLVVLAGAWRWAPGDERRPARLDLRGVALLSAAATAVVYPLVQGRAAGWPWWILLLAAVGVAGFGGFAIYERRSRRAPIIEASLLTNRTFLAGVAVAVAFFGSIGGYLLTLNVWMQTALRLSPLHAGLTAVPLSVGIAAAATGSSRLLTQVGARRVLRVGMATTCGGMIAQVLTAATIATITSWHLLPSLLITGAGMGLVFGPLFGTALAAIDDREVGSASGVLSSAQQLGSSLGVAVIATLYFSLADPTPALATAGTASAAIVLIAFGLAGLLPREGHRR